MNEQLRGIKFWHVGVIVKNVEKAMEFYKLMPDSSKWIVTEVEAPKEAAIFGDTGFKVKIAIGKIGGIGYELIEPLDKDSFQAKFLAASGEGIHHVSYLLGNKYQEVVDKLLAEGNKMISAFEMPGNMKVSFIEAKNGAMIFELLSTDKAPV